jgi:hypothetical protein
LSSISLLSDDDKSTSDGDESIPSFLEPVDPFCSGKSFVLSSCLENSIVVCWGHAEAISESFIVPNEPVTVAVSFFVKEGLEIPAGLVALAAKLFPWLGESSSKLFLDFLALLGDRFRSTVSVATRSI